MLLDRLFGDTYYNSAGQIRLMAYYNSAGQIILVTNILIPLGSLDWWHLLKFCWTDYIDDKYFNSAWQFRLVALIKILLDRIYW